MSDVISEQPKAQLTDQLLHDKLMNVERFFISQGHVALEALTGGAWPNTYIISDMGRQVQVAGRPESVPTPLFMVKEESNCCARICCNGNQSLTAKVYHTQPNPTAGRTVCGCYGGHTYTPDLQRPAAMTLQREGCCSKFLGCFACSPKCQNEMHMHAGDVTMSPYTPPGATGVYFGKSLVPKGGGGFTPTINLFSNGKDEPFTVVEGPTCYAGWLGLCTDTHYVYSSAKGKSGDIGLLKKNRAEGCGDCCAQMCTNVDKYEFVPGPNFKALSPEQRATILGNIIHIEYIFFENDLPPVYFQQNGSNTTMICTLCQVYCYGCCCPVQICIPLSSNQ